MPILRRNGSIRNTVHVWTGAQGRQGLCSRHMTWLTWLLLAVIIAAVAAVTGIKPKDTRHVSRTRMMGAARISLIVIVAIIAYVLYQARSGS
jgi:hypothetical protein